MFRGNRTVKIASAGNTEIPALLALEAKGYSVSCAEAGGGWIAKNSVNEVIAESPLELLGLVEIIDFRGESWHAQDHEIERCLNRYPGLGG